MKYYDPSKPLGYRVGRVANQMWVVPTGFAEVVLDKATQKALDITMGKDELKDCEWPSTTPD